MKKAVFMLSEAPAALEGRNKSARLANHKYKDAGCWRLQITHLRDRALAYPALSLEPHAQAHLIVESAAKAGIKLRHTP